MEKHARRARLFRQEDHFPAALPLHETRSSHCRHALEFSRDARAVVKSLSEVDEESIMEVGVLGEGREADFTKCFLFFFQKPGEI